MAFSLDDKNVKTLLVVVVVGLVLYLLVSYMHDSKRPHAHVFGDEPNNHNNRVVGNNTNNSVNNVVVNNVENDTFLDYANEGFTDLEDETVQNTGNAGNAGNTVEEVGNVVQPSENLGENEDYNSVPQGTASGNQLPAECYPKDVLSSSDLLPSDANSKWAQANPNGQGSLTDKNFLNAGFHVGVNTVGQSLRNANRQLRSDPPNPQVKVSPWMQTTIEPDVNRKAMEIGA
jgi:hypothetical protein